VFFEEVRFRPKGGINVTNNADDPRARIAPETPPATSLPDEAAEFKLRRWYVSYRSGSSWYPVGEFVALDAATAIERAVEIFGPGEQYQAEEIPWDAAPLSRTKPTR
jgi:hypothetical protein